MRSAVCFSGHLRTFEKTFESCQRFLLQPNQADVFIHTWGTLGSHRPEDEPDTIVQTESVLDRITAAYSPKKMTIEPQRDFKIFPFWCFATARTPPINVVSKWYSANCANELRKQHELETGEQYDVIINCRTDMLFHEPILVKEVVSSVLYLPGNIKVPENTYHDYMAYGSSEIMNKYFETGKHFDFICQKLHSFRPEAVLTKYLQLQNIPLAFFNVEYSLVRMNGEVRRA